MKQDQTRISATRKVTITAMFAALSSVLMFLSFNVPPMPSFIKFDFSEFPALIATFCLGPISGVSVCLIKNIVNLPFTTTGCVGELSNFLIGAAFVLPAGLIYRSHKNFRGAMVGMIIGCFSMAVLGLFANYYIAYPAYSKLMPIDVILNMYHDINPKVDGLWQALLIFNMPFTFIKGLVNSIITALVYKRLSPIIQGRRA